jgi:hypothetical protein
VFGEHILGVQIPVNSVSISDTLAFLFKPQALPDREFVAKTLNLVGVLRGQAFSRAD